MKSYEESLSECDKNFRTYFKMEPSELISGLPPESDQPNLN